MKLSRTWGAGWFLDGKAVGGEDADFGGHAEKALHACNALVV
jgi:hypothetical protein